MSEQTLKNGIFLEEFIDEQIGEKGTPERESFDEMCENDLRLAKLNEESQNL